MKFDSAAALSSMIRLFCVEACDLQGMTAAFVEGIKIGERQCAQAFSPGEKLDVPVNYFPHVNLPTEVRFVHDGVEIAPPLMVTAAEDVMAILGHGHIRVENLVLENSLLRGTIINTVNGLHTATAFIKINGQVVRAATVEAARGRDEGGAVARFAVPIRSNDFVESGLSIDVYAMGVDYPVASFTYLKSDSCRENRRLIELEERVRQVRKSTFLQLEMLRDSFENRLDMQQERIDRFVEYAMSLIIDRLAGPLATVDAVAFIDGLRNLGAVSAPSLEAASVTVRPSSVTLALDGSALAFGWYDLEFGEDGEFRWMGHTALLRNPYVGRPVSSVQLTVLEVYGATEPNLRATLDDQELLASVKQDSDSFVVTFTAPGGRRLSGETMQIESFVTGCPAVDQGLADVRILSVAVTRIEIVYDELKGSAA